MATPSHSDEAHTKQDSEKKTWVSQPPEFLLHSIEVEQLAKNGELPPAVAEYRLDKLREHTEVMEELHKRFGQNPTEEQHLQVLRERYSQKPSDWMDKEVECLFELQTFLEGRWKALANLSPATRPVRHSRDLISSKFPSEICDIPTTEITIENLNLTETQDRAVFTLCQLLAKKSERWNQTATNYYMGNYETGLVELNGEQIPTARLLVSPNELAKEYYGRSDFNSSQLRHVLSTVHDITKKNPTLIHTEKITIGTMTKYNRIRTNMPLFLLSLIDESFTEQDCKEFSGSTVHETKTKLLFRLGPIFTHDIANRYIEFPEDLHIRMARTAVAGKGGRIGQPANLLRDYLFREVAAGKMGKRPLDEHGHITIERDEDTLITALNLRKEWEEGRKGRVRAQMQKAFDMFIELKLLVNIDLLKGAKGQRKYKMSVNSRFR